MRVLVAEDDPGLRDVIALGLREAGYQVDTVDRGDDAIDQFIQVDKLHYELQKQRWFVDAVEAYGVAVHRLSDELDHAHVR